MVKSFNFHYSIISESFYLDVMTEKPQLSEEEASLLLRQLLHKEGNWVEWGKACTHLQKAGYNRQTIFEQTGFQGSQQNLIVVAAQVYDSIAQAGASPELLSYCQGPVSDVLYEFRILNQAQRAAAAELAQEKKLNVDDAKEVARAIQDFSRLSQLPGGFVNHPGDAIAYQCWKRGRQQKDLQHRSRLIARGLKFAHSHAAREKIEQLLSDFTVVPQSTAPLMPLYRLEEEEELGRNVPLAGTFPIRREDLEVVKAVKTQAPFGIVTYSGSGAMVPLPGWQVILKAEDPVAILYQSERLPQQLPGMPEQVLVVVDRGARQWDVNSYFLVEQGGKLELKWFAESPSVNILGRLMLILRLKKIF